MSHVRRHFIRHFRCGCPTSVASYTCYTALETKFVVASVAHHGSRKPEVELRQTARRPRAVLEDILQRQVALKEKASSQNSPAVRAELREEHRKLLQEQATRLKQILTPEQFAKYQQLRTQPRRRALIRPMGGVANRFPSPYRKL